jgi:hypothetical protein
MQRYFFDFTDGDHTEHDFKGQELRTAAAAYRVAELMVIDESVEGSRMGWTLRVSDAAGKQLFSLPVILYPELMAA